MSHYPPNRDPWSEDVAAAKVHIAYLQRGQDQLFAGQAELQMRLSQLSHTVVAGDQHLASRMDAVESKMDRGFELLGKQIKEAAPGGLLEHLAKTSTLSQWVTRVFLAALMIAVLGLDQAALLVGNVAASAARPGVETIEGLRDRMDIAP